MKLKFKNWDCRAVHTIWDDGSPRISLVATGDDPGTIPGEPVAEATVPWTSLEYPVPLNTGECWVKDYSENEGILVALCSYGVVEDTGRRLPTGFVEVCLCKILPRR